MKLSLSLFNQTSVNLHVPVQRDQLGEAGPIGRCHVRLHGRHLPRHQVEVLGPRMAKRSHFRTGKQDAAAAYENNLRSLFDCISSNFNYEKNNVLRLPFKNDWH